MILLFIKEIEEPNLTKQKESYYVTGAARLSGGATPCQALKGEGSDSEEVSEAIECHPERSGSAAVHSSAGLKVTGLDRGRAAPPL